MKKCATCRHWDIEPDEPITAARRPCRLLLKPFNEGRAVGAIVTSCYFGCTEHRKRKKNKKRASKENVVRLAV